MKLAPQSIFHALKRRLVGRAEESSARNQSKADQVAPVSPTPDGYQRVNHNGASLLYTLEDRLTPRRVKAENARAIRDLLTDAGIPYFAIPDERKQSTQLGITENEWGKLYSALESGAARDLNFYFRLDEPKRGNRSEPVGRKLNSEGARQSIEAAERVGILWARRDERTGELFGEHQAVWLTKWIRTDEGILTTNVVNNRAETLSASHQVPATTTVNGVELDTYEPLAETSAFEHCEPIDVVFMWVDGSDPTWSKRHDAVIEQLKGEPPKSSADPARFRDNGELKYALRSIEMYGDWIRNIYLVTDSQVPSWLNTSHPRIIMVDHKELFGDSGRLPTYNSHAIESRIHHIPGLSTKYLLMNDDLFFGRETSPDMFFRPNGIAKFFLSKKSLPLNESYPLPHEAARRNTADLIQRDFGIHPSRIFLHAPAPQLRDLLFELEQRYQDEFQATWSHQLRSPDDSQINGWLHHYGGFALGRTEPAKISYSYFGTDSEHFIPRLKQFRRDRSFSVFCINDTPNARPENLEFLAAWFEEYFPYAAPWEL